jgi:5'-3' exonuclease
MEAPDGTPTFAAYGFANTLLKYLGESGATHAAVVFDYALTSFRNDLEPGYKAGRTDAPPDLEPQFDLCVEAAEALGVRSFEREGFEADDLIGTLSDQLVRRRARVVVVSADKDLSQLVREDGRVVLHDNARATTLDAAGVRAKFGVAPARIPDWLGLVGDAVDNLPGVPGVGPKTAAALLEAFGSIEGIPADPEAWRGVPVRGAVRMAARIAEHRDRALRTRKLATVVRDVPGVRATPRELRVRAPDAERLAVLCERLGWGGLLRRVLG